MASQNDSSETDPLSPTPTDPLIGSNEQILSDEYRPGDNLAFYTALVRAASPYLSSTSFLTLFLGFRIGEPLTPSLHV